MALIQFGSLIIQGKQNLFLYVLTFFSFPDKVRTLIHANLSKLQFNKWKTKESNSKL